MKREDLVGKAVGFIIWSEKYDRYTPFVGKVIDSPDDDDAFLQVLGKQPATDRLEDAQACFNGDNAQGLSHVFLTPVPSSLIGATWLSELTVAEEEAS